MLSGAIVSVFFGQSKIYQENLQTKKKNKHLNYSSPKLQSYFQVFDIYRSYTASCHGLTKVINWTLSLIYSGNIGATVAEW